MQDSPCYYAGFKGKQQTRKRFCRNPGKHCLVREPLKSFLFSFVNKFLRSFYNFMTTGSSGGGQLIFYEKKNIFHQKTFKESSKRLRPLPERVAARGGPLTF